MKLYNTNEIYTIQMRNYTIQIKFIQCKYEIIQYE